ncbi:hypothetical protein GCM10009740_20010 [Terrabacter terrae]|uniref:Plastocyanin-like domain-containing protein n=1 Tax=Terrabacter terrae TaxID=318434 RepID=A0ABP5FMX6_9MICO
MVHRPAEASRPEEFSRKASTAAALRCTPASGSASGDRAASGLAGTRLRLDVGPGETYEVAFVADTPGIWTDHCHTLKHAVDGLVAHVMYEGVTTRSSSTGRRATTRNEVNGSADPP